MARYSIKIRVEKLDNAIEKTEKAIKKSENRDHAEALKSLLRNLKRRRTQLKP